MSTHTLSEGTICDITRRGGKTGRAYFYLRDWDTGSIFTKGIAYGGRFTATILQGTDEYPTRIRVTKMKFFGGDQVVGEFDVSAHWE
ncbi:MAG: hypothetical protein ACKVOE_03830 [Rickettsiales bacterium]